MAHACVHGHAMARKDGWGVGHGSQGPHHVQDLFEQLRPRMERHTSFEVTCETVAVIEAEEAAAAAAGVQADESDSDEDGSRPGLASDDEGDFSSSDVLLLGHSCVPAM